MKTLYPDFDAYKTEFLEVGSGHKIYFEQSGNPDGQPVIVFHGGPGGFCKPRSRKFFNPEKYRVILFDQRGCGQSFFEDYLRDNTTADLLSDAEKIRKHLKIEKWHVFGSSWGSTLALAYAEKNPEQVRSLIVCGIYFGSKAEDAWLFGGGAQKFFPEKFQELKTFMDSLNLEPNSANLAKIIFGNDEQLALKASILSDKWEDSVCKPIPDDPQELNLETEPINNDVMLKNKRIMFHYTKNACFLEPEQLLNDAVMLQTIPTAIIQGRYDLICPFETAWKLSQALPHAEFKIIPLGGHFGRDIETINAIIDFTDRFVDL